MTIKQLQQAVYDANRRASELSSEYENAISERVREATVAARKEFEPLQARYVEANKEAYAAREALDEAKENEAMTGKDLKHPIGTRMLEWRAPKYGYAYDQTKKPTGLVGVIEVWTRDSESPDNFSNYRIPHRGDAAIRILKKDGAPSRKFERASSGGDFYGWYPEGVNPNKEKKA